VGGIVTACVSEAKYPLRGISILVATAIPRETLTDIRGGEYAEDGHIKDAAWALIRLFRRGSVAAAQRLVYNASNNSNTEVW
jgi:hypothetical protein